MYAIVDIETTGSYPHKSGVTEIAIVLHNGKEIEGRYSTLVNPLHHIPYYVARLTGITNKMVAAAPVFNDVAANIYNLLDGRIFVAHNVNFDYNFLQHHFEQAGYRWNSPQLCTITLSKKAFPGLIKYGLEHLCEVLDINVGERHRAGGDADATTILFEKILARGGEKMIREMLKKKSIVLHKKYF